MADMRRKLIFLNRYYRPDHAATAQLLTDVAEHLAARGERVLVLTSRQLYENARARLPGHETLAGVEVFRLGSTSFGRAGLAGRALDYASFLLAVFFALVRYTRRGDVVVAKTDPPYLGTVALAAVRLRGASLVNWLQDLFPDVVFATGAAVPQFLAPALSAARDLALRGAVLNVAIGQLMAKRIAHVAGERRVRLVQNWAPFAHVRPVAREANLLRHEWGLDGRFVVGYSGNMGRVHEFDTMLQAAHELRDDPGIVFLVIGGGAHRDAFERSLRRLGLRNVHLKPYQPAERLAESLSAADVHVVNLRPELEGLVVPSKFYGIAAAGRPTVFIGDPHGEIAGLVAAHGCGMTVRTGDAAALARALRELRDAPGRLAEMSACSRAAAERHFGRDVSLEAWRALLGSLPSSRELPAH